MTATVPVKFIRFRKRLMLTLTATLLFVSFGMKYFNLLIAYMIKGDTGYIEDVSGLELVKFAREVSWGDALNIGFLTTISASAALFLLWVVSNLKDRKPVVFLASDRVYNREILVYGGLWAAAGVLGVAGITAAVTMSMLVFAPLLIFALLNPLADQKKARLRLGFAFIIGIFAFAVIGSKIILFNLVLAATLNAIWSGRGRIAMIATLGTFIILYPYFNVFRGYGFTMTSGMAWSLTLAKIGNDIAIMSPLELFLNSYDALLGRIVGLDGVIVSSTFQHLPDMSDSDISYALVGFEGVGVSLSMFGQLSRQVGSITMAAILFPFVVAAIWRLCVMIDRYLSGLGFVCFGSFIYFKALQVMLGGIRTVDIKLMATGIIIVAMLGTLSLIARVKSFSGRPFMTSEPPRHAPDREPVHHAN